MEKKRIGLYIVVAAVLVLIIYLPGFSRLQRLKEKIDEQKARIGLLEEQNSRLKEELAMMKTDPVFLEKKAREKLGIIKKGEIIYKKD